MKIRRSRAGRVAYFLGGSLMLSGTGYLTWTLVTESNGASASGLASAAFITLISGFLATMSLRTAFRPFRLDIGPYGLTLRAHRVDRLVPWHEIEAIILCEEPQATKRLGHPPRIRLTLLPAAGTELGLPSSNRPLTDGRTPLLLLDVADSDTEPEELCRALAQVAGARFQNLTRSVGQPPEGLRLAAFPAGRARARVIRWLDRRKALVFTGWCLLVLVPALLGVYAAARVGDLTGLVAFLVATALALFAVLRLAPVTGDCRGALDLTASICDTNLVLQVAGHRQVRDLHAGKVRVLRPGTLTGFGKAWVLTADGPTGRPIELLLLSDPCSGRVRPGADLGALAAVLADSPAEDDRRAAGALRELARGGRADGGGGAEASDRAGANGATEASDRAGAGADGGAGGGEPVGHAGPATVDGPVGEVPEPTLWEALRGVGRAVRLLAVAATVGLAAGAVYTGPPDGPGAGLTASALMITFVLLATLFGLNLIFRLWVLLIPFGKIGRSLLRRLAHESDRKEVEKGSAW